ncbi:TetR/AcrR family transcriptional regulator [Amycolatopsis anabasis]|uniref:TetR/AcrR family transcriptional regulator n=1 Tax=Amycolatopsis anabasis TaxID=1840409 RepID=UPI00131DAB27|nr:TetR/AcrR family transcriptional regulator [Amycolatopsis anabasis]
MTENAENHTVPDGRSERWRERRAARREKFVDATFRAILEHGPDVSMDEIAREAGVAKARFYRYFTDKRDLFDAVAERTMTGLWDRLAPALDFANPSRAGVRKAIKSYVDMIDKVPNVARFLAGSQFVDRSYETDPVLEGGRKLATLMAQAFAAGLDAYDVSSGGVEPWAHATVGAVAAASGHWLETLSMSKRRLTEYLTTYVWGALQAALASEGILVDAD